MKTTRSLLTFGLVLAATYGATRHARAADTPARPNIIFILADDMGYNDLGSYGAKLVKTPRLDRMAAEGVRFTRHYAGAPVCGPSRCTLATGLHNGHGQLRGNFTPGEEIHLAAGSQTIASCLKNAGYAKAMIGKWGLGMAGTSGDPLRQGFDLYADICATYWPTIPTRNICWKTATKSSSATKCNTAP